MLCEGVEQHSGAASSSPVTEHSSSSSNRVDKTDALTAEHSDQTDSGSTTTTDSDTSDDDDDDDGAGGGDGSITSDVDKSTQAAITSHGTYRLRY